MVTGSRRHARGFTLIELMTVVFVAVILAAVGVPSFSRLIAAQRVKAAASNLQQALLVTRSEALKRNTDVAVMPAGGQWSSGWTVVNASSGAVLNTYPPAPNITISGPTSITYQSSGRISPGTDTTFRVASSAASDLRCVSINLTGMPSVRASGC
jgi:type IV fimbrial biogenesis protein FimT